MRTADVEEALNKVREQLAEAVAARKCHGCGCLHQTVHALEATESGRRRLGRELAEGRRVFIPKKYDCLGCAVCYPAIAANAFADAFPGEGEALDLCLTEERAERPGWPPLPGDYHVLRYRAPVAVCTLNSDRTAAELAQRAPEGLAVVGTLHTENLGIERIVKNLLGNPHVRRLVVCGEDTRQRIGHLPGQSLVSLFENGLDESGRIRGARGKRPVLKNVAREQVEAFLQQIELVPRIGEEDPQVLVEEVRRCAAEAPGVFEGGPPPPALTTVVAAEPGRLLADPAGYCVVYPDRARGRLLIEHYTNSGLLDCIVEGATPAALYGALIERGLISRLDHAAYLGRELARAEQSLRTGEAYVQDRASGETVVGPAPSCGWAANSETGEMP